jgi:hypothetical protein
VIDEQRVAGYYTLVSASLLLSDLPASMAKKLPRYPTVPAVRMERLAVDQAHKGLGGALHCAARSEIAAYATDGDAKDEAAAAFYQNHGFIALPDSPLFLPPGHGALNENCPTMDRSAASAAPVCVDGSELMRLAVVNNQTPRKSDFTWTGPWLTTRLGNVRTTRSSPGWAASAPQL